MVSAVTGNVQIGVKFGLQVCCYGSISTIGGPIFTIFDILQLEQDVETVVKVLQPGPLGIIEHEFTAEEINKAKSTVNRAVENWRRNAYAEQNSPFLRDFIGRDRM